MANNVPMANPMSPQAQFAMLNPQSKKGLIQRGKEYVFGEPGRPQFLPTQTGPQQQLQGLTIENLMQLLQPGMQNAQQYQQAFAPIAQNARQNFYTSTIPSLAERFTALGGGQNSSAFQGALGQAGAGLESQLGALGAQFGQQQQGLDQNFLLNLLRYAFLPQFETQYLPATGGLFGSAAEGLGKGAGSFASQAGKLGAHALFGLI